jgi:16S rRNA (uracil1498-N3)-methyltransferase
MNPPRIFVPEPLVAGSVMALPAQAGVHVSRVLRLRPGAALTLFDGRGGEHAGELEDGGGRQVRVRVGSHAALERESPLATTLLQGVARGERMDLIVQKATELGVTRIVPVLAERSVVQLEGERLAQRTAHWREVAISACEQCGRNRVPEVQPALRLREACGVAPEHGARKWLLDPGATRALADVVRADAAAGTLRACVLLVGPEGGLSEGELVVARELGFAGVTLGPRVLRTESAALVALSVLQALAGDFAG